MGASGFPASAADGRACLPLPLLLAPFSLQAKESWEMSDGEKVEAAKARKEKP